MGSGSETGGSGSQGLCSAAVPVRTASLDVADEPEPQDLAVHRLYDRAQRPAVEGQGGTSLSATRPSSSFAADPEEAALPVKRWAWVNPWDAPKDGKQRVADADWKVMRK